MTYIIAEPCIDIKDLSCVDVCPVDCIHEFERILIIDPEECIDCGAMPPSTASRTRRSKHVSRMPLRTGGRPPTARGNGPATRRRTLSLPRVERALVAAEEPKKARRRRVLDDRAHRVVRVREHLPGRSPAPACPPLVARRLAD